MSDKNPKPAGNNADRVAELEAENERLKGTTTPEQKAAEVQTQKAVAARAVAKQQKLEKERVAKAIAAAPKVKNLSQTPLCLFGTDVGIGDTVPVPGFEETAVIKEFIKREVISVAK